jgi:hypothetical protein
MGAYADLLPDSSDSANTSSSVARSSGNQRVDAFVEQYRPIAERVAEQTGNDPELYLAKWGLETGWGKSIIPGTNNLGNIKDFSGSGVSAKDNATGSVDRYRQYKDANQFADDYASLLNRRYKNALNVGSDMDTFATELKRAGYAEDPNYVSKLKSAYNMLGGSAAQSDASQPSPNAHGEYEPRTDYSAALRQFDKVPNDTYEANRLASTPKGMSISKEISAAIDSYQANLWSIPAAMGSEYALNAMLENKSAAEQQWADSGAPQSFSEMEFGKNFGQYFAHMAIQSAPYMLEFIASGFGVGSLAKGALANTAKGVAEKAAIEAAKQGATKEAAKKAGEVAAKEFMGTVYTASGVAGSYPSAVGDVLSNQYEQSGKFNLPAAAALGVPYAALNAAGAEGMLTRGLARGLPKTSLTAKGAAGFAGRAALTGAEAGLMEGSTETGQEVMNQLGRMAVDPDAKIDDKRALEAYKESFIAGGLLGGVPGAVAGGFRKPEDAKLQPPAPVANSPLSSAVNTAQHVEKQRQQAAVDDHLEQILGMIAQRDDLTERIAGLQNMIDRADPSSEDGQRIRAMQSDMQMRRDSLVAQLDAAKAFYGGDQTANVGPTNDPLILGNEQMSRIYQVTQNLLNDPASLDPESRSGLLKGFSVMRNRTLPEATRIDAAISLIATMDDMAARRAAAASGRADEREWNAFASDEAARDGEASRVAPNQQQGVVTQSAPALATDDRARKAAAAEYEAAYQDLVKAEQLGASDQELMQRQIAMRNAEARLQEINDAIESNRAKETAEKRGALLDRVLASNPGNPNRAFDRALRLEGFRDSTFTEEEKSKIARFNELRNIQEDGISSAPNEAGYFGIREKRASAPAGRYQHLADMLSSGWQLANRHQLTGPNGEVYNLKGAGEAQFVRNKLNQKAGNGNQSPRGGAQGGTDQGDFGVGGAGSNGPVPQGGGNGSGQANAIPDTDAPAGAVSEAEATGAGNQPNDPLNQNPTGRLTPLDDPRIAKYAGDLRSMAPDAGYAERGGRNLRDYNDNFTSRTVWIPTAEWFLPGMLNSPQASVDAVERAIRGYPMKKKEKLHVQGMMDFLDRMNGVDDESHAEQLATLSDIAYEGESADAQNIIDTLGDVDLESNGAWADEVESMRALGFTEEEINEITRRKQGAFGAIGEEAAGVPAGEAQGAIPEGDGNGNGQAEGQEGFSLDQQTNEEAAAEYAQQQAGEPGETPEQERERIKKESEIGAGSFSLEQEKKPESIRQQEVLRSNGMLFGANGQPTEAAKSVDQPKNQEDGQELSDELNRLNPQLRNKLTVKWVDAGDDSTQNHNGGESGEFMGGHNGSTITLVRGKADKNTLLHELRHMVDMLLGGYELRKWLKEDGDLFGRMVSYLKAEREAGRIDKHSRMTDAEETAQSVLDAYYRNKEVLRADFPDVVAFLEQMGADKYAHIFIDKNQGGAAAFDEKARESELPDDKPGMAKRKIFRNGKSGVREVHEVDAQDVAIAKLPDHQFFVFKDEEKGAYSLTEASTGLRVGIGETAEAAIANFKAALEKVGVETFAQRVADSQKIPGADGANPTGTQPVADSAPSPVNTSMRDMGAKAFADGLPRVAPEGLKGADKVRWLTGYDDAKKVSHGTAQPKVFYRDDNGVLWGIPYEMREGQQPKDIKPEFRGEWQRLSGAHWSGNTSLANVEAAAEAEQLSDGEWSDAPISKQRAENPGVKSESEENKEQKPAYADDAELQDALSHLGDVLGDVFGAKLNITGKQYGASDLLPAMSKVIELLIKRGFKSFRESVGAATNAMRGNANTKGFVDQITPRQWKAAYNSVAEFHEGTESEEDVAKYSAEQIQKIIALPEKIKEAEQATNHDATPGQKEAGNYAKGKFAWHGLNIAVETAKGEDRTDKETNGEKWRVTMPATYGYILGTVGADKDHVDVFMGDKPESQRVYVVNQTKPGSTEFDEHKIMLGYESEGAAIGDYLLSFSDTFGASVLGSVSGPYTIEQFKEMLAADRFKKAKPLDSNIAYVNPRMEKAETVKPKDALNKVAKTIGVANGYSADLFDGYHSYQDFSAAADSAESIKYKPAGTWMVAGWVSDNGDTNYIGFESLGGGKWRATGSIQGSIDAALEPKNVEPGTRTNGTKEKAAAERLAQLLDKMDQVRIDRNTPEGSAKGIVRSVIEELRKERTAVSVSELLETASQRLSRQHAPFSEVIDQVVESLRSDVSPVNKGDIKQADVSLDKFGLTVRRSQTKNGTPTWEVSGNTRDHVAALRNAGGKWYGPKKVWSFYSEESPEGKILAALGASPDASEIALSEIEVERKSEGTGRIKTYKQRADEALSEIDERMSLGKQLLECLNS